jgi:hypothetical protein
MKKITLISERYFLGSYIAQQRLRHRFDTAFVLGVVLTLIVPQLIFSFYFGSFFALVFGVCAVAGGGFGVRASRRSSRPFTELQLSRVSQTSETFKKNHRMAA